MNINGNWLKITAELTMSYLNEDDDDEPERLGTGRRDEGTGRRDEGTGRRDEGTGRRDEGTGRRDGDQTGNRIRGTGDNRAGQHFLERPHGCS
ncbi:hypothetical protein R3I93_016278 [Phoxinus phoxinus]|uniref:Uncharacterized protein n=1 Tax=Phoxinus phoxinus TaxID=58324 RepID=A0AAN9CLJ8_9TELE